MITGKRNAMRSAFVALVGFLILVPLAATLVSDWEKRSAAHDCALAALCALVAFFAVRAAHRAVRR